MFISKLLLKSAVAAHRLAKVSPVLNRQLKRLSLTLAFKAVSSIAEDDSPRPCAGGCRCGRVG